MRRQPITTFSYTGGFNDSIMPIAGDASTYAAGSCNSFVLGDGLTRPFGGYVSKGTDSGGVIAVQLGSSWGSLQSYTNVTASGSLVKDFLNTLYAVGAGKLSYEGTKVEIGTGSFNLSSNSDINTTTDIITKTAHGLTTGRPVLISAVTTLPTVTGTALSSTTSYYAIVLTVNTFQLAYTYTAAMAGTPAINFTSQGVGTITFSTGADATASSILQIASISVNTNWYSYYDQAGLDQPPAPTVTVPTTPGTGYTGLINGAIAFKIGAMRDRTQAGENIYDVNIAVKSIASTTSAVVVPINKTVKIQFPVAQAGQTHWGVFASKQGFGGTGVLLRIGYRTSSATDAQWIWGIPEETVAAAVGRQLEFDFQDGDLYPEEAWLFDYQPPPGTHFLRLESCGVVLGCYDGTVCAVSLPNFLESYHPRHLLYLPEPVTAVLHRQSDDFAYVAGRNSIHAIQYVGYRGDDLPSATVTTISPDVGIAKQCNWAQCGSTIVAFLEGKGLVMMSAGTDGQINIDYEFGKEVANTTKDWDTTAVVAWNPTTQSVVAGFNDQSVSYCFESRVWGTTVYNADAGITGSWLSAINSRGELIVSLFDHDVHTAYSYDNNSNTTRMPTVAVSRWLSSVAGARSNNIYELESAIRQGTATEPLVMGLHTNLFRTHIRTVAMTAASNVVTASSSVFNDTFTGKWMAVFGVGVGNQNCTTNSVTSTCTLTNHGFYTGQCITLAQTGGGFPGGLAASTPYYVIVVTANTFQLATTLNNALAGTALTFTGAGKTLTAVVNFLIGKVTYVSATTVTLTNITTGSAQNAGTSVSAMFALVGVYFRPVTPQPNTEQSLINLRPAQQNCRELCVSVWNATDAVSGALFTGTAFGTASQSSVVRTS